MGKSLDVSIYEKISQKIPGSIVEFKKNHQTDEMFFTFVSGQSEEVFGRSLDEVVNNKNYLMENLHEQDLPKVVQELDESVSQQRDYDLTTRIWHPKIKEWRWINAKGRPEVDKSDSNVTYWYGFLIDQTETVKLHKEIERGKARFDSFTRQLPGAIYEYVTNSDNEIGFNYVSPQIKKITGSSVSEIIESSNFFEKYVYEQDQVKFFEASACAQKQLTPMKLDFRGYNQASGALKWNRIESAPVEGRDGSVHWYGYWSDITIEKELQNLYEDEQKKLVVLSRLAGVGETVGEIAHEINTPLAIIKANSSILKQKLEKGSFDQQNFSNKLSKIDLTVDRISKIIEGLRSFISGAGTEEKETINVKEIVDELTVLCNEVLGSSKVKIKVLMKDSDIFVTVVKVQIIQVLLNLVKNAFDVVRSCVNPCVEVRVSKQVEDFIDISIVDNGPDFDQELLKNFFTPFFTTKSRDKGTGLGLSISKKIIERNGGKIWAERFEGQTYFTVRIPINSPH